jgi:hypothetical protein
MEISEKMQLWMDQEQMIGTMFRYPPFSTKSDLYFAAIKMTGGEEIPDNMSLDEAVDWQLQKQADVMQKYAQEFEEASLWMMRYPLDSDEATEMAMSMDGKSDDDIQIHLATRG